MNVIKGIPAVVALALGSIAIAHAEGKHWAYSGHGGPAEWGALDAEFAAPMASWP